MQEKRLTIGVVIGNANSPHTNEIIKGVRAAGIEAEVNIIYFTGVHSSYFFKNYFETKNDEDFDYQIFCLYDYIKLCSVDAIILSYGTLSVFWNNRELLQFLRKIKNIPTIILEDRAGSNNSRYIIADNGNGIKLIMDHLADYHGYRKFAFLSGPKGNTDADERLQAFINSLSVRNIEYTDKMVAFGDFSESVEEEVNQLLDDNPDVEALVCANDKMAGAAYAVINERKALYEKAVESNDIEGMKRYNKHIVGKDINNGHGIAITGYDNVPAAENMDPPLTTVVQNAYTNGYLAVFSAIELCEKGDTKNISSAPRLVTRNSCGCIGGACIDFVELDEYYSEHIETYAVKVSEKIAEGILLSDVNEEVSDKVAELFYDLIYKFAKRYVGIDPTGINADEIADDVKKIVAGEYGKFISLTSVARTLSEYSETIIHHADLYKHREAIIEAIYRINDYIHSKIFEDSIRMVSFYEHRTWFMPLISRDMANYIDSEKEMYRNAMCKMKILEIGNVYLFMLKEPIIHKKEDIWSCPNELYLMAYTANGEVVAYDKEEAPLVGKDNTFDKYIKNENKPYYASIINLFSGEYQYGVMIAEIESENVLSLYYAAVQISTALKYCEMSRAQKTAQNQLEKMISEVEQKNEMLRALSEYDHLTGCLNRRGFIESVNEAIKENDGRSACILFADVDHLKEINDKFGHNEGDFAIENVANTLKTVLPENALIARMGGDEFVSMVFVDGSDESRYVREIKEANFRLNAVSAKPYYVECSVGIKSFICSEKVNIEDIISCADESLYEAKKYRKESIVKSLSIW